MIPDCKTGDDKSIFKDKKGNDQCGIHINNASMVFFSNALAATYPCTGLILLKTDQMTLNKEKQENQQKQNELQKNENKSKNANNNNIKKNSCESKGKPSQNKQGPDPSYPARGERVGSTGLESIVGNCMFKSLEIVLGIAFLKVWKCVDERY